MEPEETAAISNNYFTFVLTNGGSRNVLKSSISFPKGEQMRAQEGLH